jgi:hypothetical protein
MSQEHSYIQRRRPAFFPLCLQVAAQDALEAARDSGDAAELARLLRRTSGDAQALFESAIQLAAGGGSGGEDSVEPAAEQVEPSATAEPAAAVEAAAGGSQGQQAVWQANGTGAGPSAAAPQEQSEAATEAANGTEAAGSEAGHQWYVYSYLSASLAWRSEFLASCAGAFGAAGGPGQAQEQGEQGEQQHLQQQQPYWEQAVATYLEGLQAASRGAAVLRRYRFSPSTGGRRLHESGSLCWDKLLLPVSSVGCCILC